MLDVESIGALHGVTRNMYVCVLDAHTALHSYLDIEANRMSTAIAVCN